MLLSLSFSLSLTHTLTRILACTNTLTHSIIHTHTTQIPLWQENNVCNSHALAYIPFLSTHVCACPSTHLLYIYTCAHTHTYAHTHTHTNTLSLSHSLTHKHTYSSSLTHTYIFHHICKPQSTVRSFPPLPPTTFFHHNQWSLYDDVKENVHTM